MSLIRNRYAQSINNTSRVFINYNPFFSPQASCWQRKTTRPKELLAAYQSWLSIYSSMRHLFHPTVRCQSSEHPSCSHPSMMMRHKPLFTTFLSRNFHQIEFFTATATNIDAFEKASFEKIISCNTLLELQTFAAQALSTMMDRSGVAELSLEIRVKIC